MCTHGRVMHERAVAVVTAVNSLLLVFFASSPNRSTYSTTAVSCENELRELFDTRATLRTYRQLCLFLFFVIACLASFLWFSIFESSRRPVRALFGKGGKGKLQ